MFRILSYAQMKAVLASNRSFPKHELLGDDRCDSALNKWRAKAIKIERCLLHALTSKFATELDRDQALAIANCRPGFYCGHWRCTPCYWRAYWERRQAAESMMLDMPRTALSLATIICGVTHDGIDVAGQQMQEFRGVWTERASRVPNLAWMGFFEFDYVAPQSSDFGPFKAKTTLELGYDPMNELGALVVHFHGAVVHPVLAPEQLRCRFAPAFPGYRRVQFRPEHRAKPLARNLDALVGYPMKLIPPKAALFGRGSRSAKPRDARLLLFYNRLVTSLGGLDGLRFDGAIPQT